MHLDGLGLYALKKETEKALCGARIDKIQQKNARDFIIHFRKPGESARLLLSLNPSSYRFHLTEEKTRNISPPPFCMLLRKHLSGGLLVKMEQKSLERIVDFVFETRNEFGDKTVKILRAELMGKHSNLLLLENDVIIDALRKSGEARNAVRTVLPGEKYVWPPSGGKLDLLTCSETAFTEKLLAAEDTDIGRGLSGVFEGISPLTGEELCRSAGLEPSSPVHTLGIIDYALLFKKTEALRKAAAGENVSAYISGYGKTAIFFPFAEVFGTGQDSTAPSYMETVRDFFAELEKEEILKREKSVLMKTINRETAKITRREKSIKKDLAKAGDPEILRLRGELLTSYLHLVPRGSEVILENYYTGTKETVPLNPALTPGENARKYFRLYEKAKNRVLVSEESLGRASADKTWLASVAYETETASDPEELGEIRKELSAAGLLKTQEKKKTVPGEKIPFLKSMCGSYEILIGRNNIQNEKLTMRKASDRDMWFHARNVPGSHVIVRNSTGSKLPDDVILRAAMFAGYHSKNRNIGTSDVDYTLKKNVKKPGGSKPGFVIYENFKTVHVDFRDFRPDDYLT